MDNYVTTSVFRRDDKSASVEVLSYYISRIPLRRKAEGKPGRLGRLAEVYFGDLRFHSTRVRGGAAYKIDINRNKRDERPSMYQAMNVLYDERIKAKE